MGNVGSWSTPRCTSVLLDDRALKARGGWSRGGSDKDAFGTLSRSTRRGATLSIAQIRGSRLAVMATTCPSCGAVDVYQDGKKIARIKLYSSSLKHRQVRWVNLSSAGSRPVTLRAASSKSVRIDGIAVRR